MGIFDVFRKKENREGAITEYGKVEQNLVKNEQSIVNESEKVNIEEITRAKFLMRIEDVFSITGRGTVVTGRIDLGSVSVGEFVNLLNSRTREKKSVMITGVEMFRKIVTTANAGDNVGLLLKDVKRNEIEKHDILYKN